MRNIHENLFWAFFYNCIGIPLAAGVFISLFGWQLDPMFGAAAMSLSSVCVVTNALRLNLFRAHDDNKKSNRNTKEKTNMKKTVNITGMMCGHCEARVKKTLLALPGVESAEVSHATGTAVITLNAELADEVITNAIAEQGYTVTGIK